MVFPQPLENVEVYDGETFIVSDILGITGKIDQISKLWGHLQPCILHLVDDQVKAAREVKKDQLAIGLDLLRGERDTVDDPHLLEDSSFTRVSGAEEEDLECV